MSIYSKFHKNFTSYFASLQAGYSAKYVKEVAIGATMLIVLGGGFVIHRWYVANREQQAFEALAEVMVSYQQSKRMVMGLDAVKDKEKIDQAYHDTSLLVDALYKDHAGSNLAPYFLALQAQLALDKDGDLKQALQIMDQALAGMSKHDELGSVYHLKRIKMGLDSTDELEQKTSLEKLQEFAADNNSFVQQEAQYALAIFYISQGQHARGQQLLEQLVDQAPKDSMIQSVWIKLAKEKLGITS